MMGRVTSVRHGRTPDRQHLRTGRPLWARSRSGLTLIELMLALTLTAVVLVAISMAIDLHLRLLDSRRGNVERSQVARAVLQRIADDLRGAVGPATTDFSGVTDLLNSALSGEADMGALSDIAGDIDLSDPDQAAADLVGAASDMGFGDSGSEASQDIASATTPPAVPGLYGNQYELQVDVSRLPRVDEFQRMISPDAIYQIQDIPSDVKTVAYYYRDINHVPTTATTSPYGSDVAEQTGLVRRVLDRAVTLQASESGSVTGVEDVGEVLAPEVTGIEFEYFDGTEWLFEWDSEEMGGVPMAVRITVSVATPGTVNNSSSSFMFGSSPTATTDQLSTDEIYSLVVRLPTAKPVEDTGAADTSGMESVGL